MPTADRMASLLLVLMLVQSLLGLLQSDQYRDVEWIKVTWYGNDWITLVAAVPLLSLALLHTGRESVRGRLLVLGMAGYAVYNYAFYLFGAALNVFFPLYVVSFLLAILTLGRLLSHLDVTVVADSFEAAILGLCDRNDCRDSGRALPLGVVRQLGHRYQHGLVSGPSELLIWGPLTISTTIAAVVLFRSASGTSNLYQRGANT